jgi:hypothetical protein
VTAHNSEGQASAASTSAVVPMEEPQGRPPVDELPPAISGGESVGSTLVCSEGVWSGHPVPALGYQWLREGSAIAGETTNSHVVVEADAGHRLTCKVTAINSEGIAFGESAPVAIAGIAPAAIEEPQVVGAPVVGEELTCVRGHWSGAPVPALAVQWLRDGSAITGATTAAYTVAGQDRGASLSCQVTATNSAGSAQARSAGLQIPGTGPVSETPPEIAGVAATGATLTCAPGTWSGHPQPAFAYQWLRDGAEIPAATHSTYTVVAADMGLDLTCKVIATSSEGTTSASSNPFHIPGVAPTVLQAPSVSGAGAVGQPIACQRGTWKGTPPPSFAYVWLRDGGAIESATATTYTVQLADQGHTLACKVSASNSEGSAEALSANSLAIARPAPPASHPEFPLPPTAPSVPTHAQILKALHVQLARLQHRVHLASLRKSGSYTFSFFAPAAGKLEFFWYEARTRAHGSATGKPVVLALATTRFAVPGAKSVKLVLTAAARRLIRSSSRIPLNVRGTLTPPGEAPVSWSASYLLSH